MPSAEKLDTTENHDLKSLPGGQVTLKRMSYGESVQRRAMMKMSFATGGGNKDFQGEMAMASVDIQFYEFSKCIASHNLTYSDDRPMDFSQRSTLDKLDPRIGGEIEELISKMNDFDGDDDSGN